MKQAKVKFMNEYGLGKEYNYLTTKKDLVEGDLVIVEAKEFYAVAVFSRYTTEANNATKFIVGKLDLEGIEEDKKVAFEIEKIKQQINERVKEVERQKRLDELASQDAELGSLIKVLRELEG